MGWQDDPVEAPAPPAQTAPAAAPWQGDPVVEAAPTQQKAAPGLLARIADAFTGRDRTEFPDAPEFLSALMKQGNISAEDAAAGREPGADLAAINRSAITSNPAAALDILRKNIPGLEAAKDKHGNIMLRVPSLGMTEWSYLNKPGLSARDVDEFGTQTLAMLPFLGAAGQGATIPARIASGAGFMGAGEIERRGLERLAGSEQPFDEGTLPLVTALGGALAPGVPSAVIKGVSDVASAVVAPVTGLARRAAAPGREADRVIAEAYQKSAGPGLGPMAQNLAGRPVAPADVIRHRAANELQEKAGAVGEGTYGADTRLMDLGGEPTRAVARYAANISPEARDVLNSVIQPRFEAQSERVTEFLSHLIGGPTAGQSREALAEMAKSARRPFYDKAYDVGAAGIHSDAILKMADAPAMDKAINTALKAMENRAASERIRTRISGPKGYTLEFWDQVKRSLDDQISSLRNAGERSAAADATAIRERLLGVLDDAVPAYKTARGVAQGIFQAQDALEAGEKFVGSRLSNDEARRALERFTATERDLFASGFVSRFIQQANEVGNRRNLLNTIAHSPAARERIEVALGEARARELEAFLRHESMMDFIRNAVQGNSTTARQLVELGLASSAYTMAGGLSDPTSLPALIAGILTKMGARRANMAIDARLGREIAERLVSRDPDVYKRGLQQLAEPRVLAALRKFDERVARIGNAPRGAAISTVAQQRQDSPNAMLGASAKTGNAMGRPGQPTATNPQTGERIQLDESGQWRPMP